MKIKFLFVVSAILLCCVPLRAQNRTDAKGRKQGEWLKVNTVTGKKYQGRFKDDMPEGKFLYWNAGDTLEAEAFYFRGGYASYNRFFYPDGGVMATGYYLDKQKDSIWHYYSASGRLLKTETFEKNLPNGLTVIYTDSGTVTESQSWFRGLRNGPWFIHDGEGYQMYTYKLNLTHGAYKVFYSDSTPRIEGMYTDGLKQGLWRFYFPSGSLCKEETYKNNVLVNRILYLRINGELRAVNTDTVPVVMTGLRGMAEILTSAGHRYICDDKFEDVSGIFSLDFYFFANRSTLVAFSAVDEEKIAGLLPDSEYPESDLYDGQAEAAREQGNEDMFPAQSRRKRLPMNIETPFPVFMDDNGISVLRNNFKRE